MLTWRIWTSCPQLSPASFSRARLTRPIIVTLYVTPEITLADCSGYMSYTYMFNTDFLGRVLLMSPKTTPCSTRDDVKPIKERRARHSSKHRKRMSRRARSSTPDRNDDSDWTCGRVTSIPASSPDAHEDRGCEVIDHSAEWRLAAAILDRLFLVVHLLSVACVTGWTVSNLL